MKSPFGENFEEERNAKAIIVHDSRTKEEIRDKLLKERVELSHYYKEVGKGFIIALYLQFRSQNAFSVLWQYVYLDKLMFILSNLIIFICFISGLYIVFKLQSNMIKFSINEKNFFGFLEYHLYTPYDYEEKPKPIIPFKKLLLYMLYTEIAISSFFIIDYLFEL